MTSIVSEKKGKIISFFITDSEKTDAKGVPAKKFIGRRVTRRRIEFNYEFFYNPVILEFMEQKRSEGYECIFSDVTLSPKQKNDVKIQESSIGSVYLTSLMIANMHEAKHFTRVFGYERGQKLLALVSYLVVKDDLKIKQSAQEFFERQWEFRKLAPHMTEEKINTMLESVTTEETDKYYNTMNEELDPDRFVVLDLGSSSQWSGILGNLEEKNLRDKKNLDPVQESLLCDSETWAPRKLLRHNGNVWSTLGLETYLKALPAKRRYILVSDNEWINEDVIIWINRRKKTSYILTIPTTLEYAQTAIKKARSMKSRKYHFRNGDKKETLRVTQLSGETVYGFADVKVFVFYDAKVARQELDDCNAYLNALRRRINDDPFSCEKDPAILEYFDVCINPQNGIAEFTLKADVYRNRLLSSGWLVVLSNYVKNPMDIMNAYRAKYMTGNVFQTYTTQNLYNTLNIQAEDGEYRFPVLGFAEMVIRMGIHNEMVKNHWYKKYSVRDIVNLLYTPNKVILMNGKAEFPKKRMKERYIVIRLLLSDIFKRH